jgi:hypothetical protein
MLFEQHPLSDLLTPTINDGGVNKLSSSLTSLDFYLLDDIDTYLPSIQTKKTKNDLINDSSNDNSQYQEDLLLDFDFDFNNFEEKSDFLNNSTLIDELEIEKWISQSSFPSPPMETNNSPLSSTVDDTSSTTFPWIGDEYTKNSGVNAPLSPPLSSTGSSPAPVTKRPKLSVIERKLRKKDQNKNAAEKYRIRKKSERHQLLDQHMKLKNLNKDLKLELENLTYRVQQFKKLFVDLVQNDFSTSN